MDDSVYGVSVPRLEDERLLRGEARFVDDISLPDMLEGAFVRSAYAHAKIRGIDKSAALAVTGVHAVLTLDDLKPLLKTDRLVVGLPSPSYRQDRNRIALVGAETVHVGEPIALVIANNRYIAEDAAALVDVDYDPLPAVADARDALAEGAATVHDGAEHNLLAEFDMAFGDTDAAFANAPHVFSESFHQHRGGGHSIECRGNVAAYDPLEDKLTLWSSTQTPHTARQLICDMLGRDENSVRVVSPDLGGGFGPKLIFYPEDITLAAATLILRRPVKWIEDRREHFIGTTQERDQFWEAEIAIDGEGKILGLRGSLIHDHGAFTARGVNLPYESAITVTLPYEIPAYAMKVQLALTNKVPVTPVRGAGQPQGVFVMERLLDRAAQSLGIDRAEIRRRNLVSGADMPKTKPLKNRGGGPVILDSGDYPKCQADVLARAGWDDFPTRQQAARAEGRYIGIGMANFVKGTGRGPFESATVRIAPSGQVQVATGATAMGQGTETMMAQIVAAQLGGDLKNISVTAGDSGATILGIGGFNSRQAVTAGSSAHVAALKVREKALTIAAHLLEASEADLEIVSGEIRVAGVADMKVSLGEVARSVAGVPGYNLPGGVAPGLEATEHVVIDDLTYANGSAAVEVDVDPETGHVTIQNFVLAHDCGSVMHPQIVDGQIVGAAAHGIGNALYEWMDFDNYGQPQTTNLADYLLITAPEVPRIDVIHHETPTHLNPLGVKGVGECGVFPGPAAIISAIEDALSPFNVRLTKSPLSPVEILAAID